MKGLVTICSECGTKTELRTINIEFERKGVRAVMSGIPAMVCPQCDEEYIPGEIAGAVIETVSRTIDETADLLKRTHTLRQRLIPSKQTGMRERLELAVA